MLGLSSFILSIMKKAISESGIARNGEALLEKLDKLTNKIEALESGNITHKNIASSVHGLEERILNLQRSAAGRGNLTMSDGMVLLRISLPEYFKNFDPILLANSDDRLIVPKLAMDGYYEHESTKFVCQNVKAGDHAIDIGANIGYYSVLLGVLAGWKGKVVAFEPVPKMASILRENLLINWIDSWVTSVEAACSEKSGTMQIVTSNARAGNSGLQAPKIGSGFGEEFKFRRIKVPTVRVDDYLKTLDGRVDFMKIDIEGAEILALRGAKQTIKSNPQIKIMMEWSPNQMEGAGFDILSIVKELSGLDLKCHRILGDGTKSIISFDELAAQSYGNIVLARD